jgi:hypothetical protein
VRIGSSRESLTAQPSKESMSFIRLRLVISISDHGPQDGLRKTKKSISREARAFAAAPAMTCPFRCWAPVAIDMMDGFAKMGFPRNCRDEYPREG